MAQTYKEQIQTYQEESNQWSMLQPMLLSIMQQQYPKIYENGNLLTTSAPVEPVKDVVPLVMRDDMDHLQIDVQNESPIYTKYILSNTMPRGAPSFLNNAFSYFADEPFIAPLVPEPNTTTGEFIALQEINLTDAHAAYLEKGPGRLGEINPDTNTQFTTADIFCIFYINNGTAAPIPNYQTLEVMLVEQGKTYDYITIATDDDRKLYDLNFEGNYQSGANNSHYTTGGTPIIEFNSRKLPDLISSWNLQIRYQSGYRPKAPFARDPGDYYDPEQSQGTFYLEQVYQQQTYLEKLREEFEGKAIVLNATFNSSGDVDGSDTSTIRIMINGYWKSIFDHNVLRTYNILNGFGARMNQDLVKCVDALNKVKGITILQDDGSVSPIWNEFKHIKQVNFLDITEYQRYYDRSNSGNIFEVEYMTPYEPAGSTRYYSAASTNELQAQLIQELDVLQGQQEDQYIFNNAVRDIGDDLLALRSSYASRLQSMAGGIPSSITELSPKISQIKDDLMDILIQSETPYTVQNNVPYQLIETANGLPIMAGPNVMSILHNIGEYAQWGFDPNYNDLATQIKNGYDAYFKNDISISNAFADKLFFRQQYSNLTNPIDFSKDENLNTISHPEGTQLPELDGNTSDLTQAQSAQTPPEIFFHWDLFPPFSSKKYTRSCISRYKKGASWMPFDQSVVSPSELGPPIAAGYNTTWEDILSPLTFGNSGPLGISNNNDWNFLNSLNYGYAQPTWFDQDINTIFTGAENIGEQAENNLSQLASSYSQIVAATDAWFAIPELRGNGSPIPGNDSETGFQVYFSMYLPSDVEQYQAIYENYVTELESIGGQDSEAYLASANTMIDSLATSWVTRIFNFIQTTRGIISNSGYNLELNWGAVAAFIVTKYRPDANFNGYDTLPFQSNINLNEWLQSLE